MAKASIKNDLNKKTITEPVKWKKTLMVVFISIIIFGLLLGSAFLGYEKVYAQKIYPGVKIAGYDVGGQTPAAIKTLINTYLSNLQKQHLNIIDADQTLTPTLEDIGVSFDSTKIINDAYAYGRNSSGWQRLAQEAQAIFLTKNIALNPIINEEKFNSYISKNSELDKPASDASFKVENNQVVMILSETGSKINLEKFKTDLDKNIKENTINKPITLSITALNPNISNDDVSSLKPLLETIVLNPIIVTYNNKKYTADSQTIAGWLTIHKDTFSGTKIEFSDEKINEFIASVAGKIDQKPIDKKINAVTNAVIEEGRDGVVVDRTKMLSSIKSILNSSDNADRNIAIEVTDKERSEKRIMPEDIASSGGTPGLYPGRYIEVSLSDQKLYCFDNVSAACAYTVSTGKWSTPTPVGTRTIESKDIRAYSAPYNLYMPYWNSIGGGYGIHELPEWANGTKEGESHLGTPVSHGCIRLGVGAAEFVYNWAPVGTPVYIHK